MNPLRGITKILDPRTREGLPAVVGVSRGVAKAEESAVARQSSSELSVVRVGEDSFQKRIAKRGRKTRFAYALFVFVPTGLAAIYYGLIASDRYASEAQIIVSGEEAGTPEGNPLFSLLTGATVSVAETFLVYNFVQSEEMVTRLDRLVNLREMYTNETADRLSRLSDDATDKELGDFFRQHLEVIAEPDNPVLKIRAQAFVPEDSQKILQGIIAVAEENLNGVAEKKREESIGFAVAELQKVQRRRMDVQARLNKFRREHGEINPVQTASDYGGIIKSLTESLFRERSALEAMMTYAQPNNPQAVAQRAKVRAIEKELNAARELLVGSDQSVIAPLIEQYETLQLEQRMADEDYASARKLVEMVRTEAARQHAYIMDFVRPNLPDEASEPERTKSVLIVFVACNLIFAIGFLGLTAVREQSAH